MRGEKKFRAIMEARGQLQHSSQMRSPLCVNEIKHCIYKYICRVIHICLDRNINPTIIIPEGSSPGLSRVTFDPGLNNTWFVNTNIYFVFH